MKLRDLKYLLLLFFACSIQGQDLFSPKPNYNQDSKSLSTDANQMLINNITPKNPAVNNFDFYKVVYLNIERQADNNNIISPFNHNYPIKPAQKKAEKITTQIISSYRENIKFGGFWNNYAIINFSPSVNIQPFDFVSINANQNLSCFVNIHDIKQNFRTLFIHGAAVLVIDNTFKFIFGTNKMIPSMLSFAAKNIIISFLNNSIASKNRDQIFGYNGYYYSISVRF